MRRTNPNQATPLARRQVPSPGKAGEEEVTVLLKLSPAQLAGVIEALHDAVLRRVRWSTVPNSDYQTWRTLPLTTVQTVVDNMVSAYVESLMVFQEADFAKSESFADRFTLQSEVFDLLAAITAAETWDDVPTHDIHRISDGCPICGAISGIP